MSDVWRICVIEGDASLNQTLVNALRNDGYAVQGVVNSSDAMRNLWSEEYDVVICSLNLPGADGLELLRWLRAYRSNVRPIVLGNPSGTGESDLRLQALESGAVSYIEKPVDLRLLKDELRRLLQQTGFTASLDSFDLLDVIQIITMSRKSITLLINIGLEERGTLRFQNGELTWAEYGVLRGEEAFFALAAHKNGTVTQQLADEHFVTNVTQPLSRLIFQALQYRTKYANGEPETPSPLPETYTSDLAPKSAPLTPFFPSDIDDSPFVFTSEGIVSTSSVFNQQVPQTASPTPTFSLAQEPIPTITPFESPQVAPQTEKAWWEVTGQQTIVGDLSDGVKDVDSSPTFTMSLQDIREAMSSSQSQPGQEENHAPKEQPATLPSWLTEQPTFARISIHAPTYFPSSSSSTQLPVQPPSGGAGETPSLPSMPAMQSSQSMPAMQSAQVPSKTTDDLAGNKYSSSYMQAFAPETEERRPSSAQWSQSQRQPSSPLHRPAGQTGVFETVQGKFTTSEPQSPPSLQPSQPVEVSYDTTAARHNTSDTARASSPNNGVESFDPPQAQRQVTGKNYAALVSALQTLGYSIPGFTSAAVIDVNGHPIAQVAIDDADISQTWRLLSVVQQSMLNVLQSDEWGTYEETVMTTTSRHVLMRVIGSDKEAFLVLITTREANFIDSLEIMANVEGAISAALH